MFKRTKRTKTKPKTQTSQGFLPSNRVMPSCKTKNKPKLDRITQGTKNKNLSKTKSLAANKIVAQATKIQETKKFATSDLNLNKNKNPTRHRKTRSWLAKTPPKTKSTLFRNPLTR
jgi:hypothetical protein